MLNPAPPTEYRQYRAPQDDGTALVDPAWDALPALVEQNRAQAANLGPDAPWRALRDAARAELVVDAVRATREFTDVADPPPDAARGPLILSGHQPELFHPGVWFKNLALDALAKTVGGVGVHLLIDSDLCRAVSVRTPSGPLDAPHVTAVPFDQTAEPRPYEERSIADPALLASFGPRVREALAGIIENPLAADMTGDLADAAAAGGTLGAALSHARRRIEGQWGSATLELPMSRVCDTASFRQFACLVLSDLPRFHAAYNDALAGYRLSHRLRNAAQPLPDLVVEDGWRETPFWVWTESDPTRRALFARPMSGKQLELTDRSGGAWSLAAHDAASALSDFRSAGVKVRSRALLTTLYCRLVLADLFLHGIGGAKYDQVTDDLCRRFFGVAPPPHATLSATIRLPVDRPEVSPSSDADLRRRLRELRFHPEKFVDHQDPATARLVEAKHAAVAQPAAEGSNRERHERIVRANEALHPLVAAERRDAVAEREALADRQQTASVLGSREYSFSLYPGEYLHEQMKRLLP